MKCDFSYRHYKEIMEKCLKEGYEFISFDVPINKNKRSIILRHDIDYSVDAALTMAKIENNLGISSTYLLLLDGPYNVFKEKDKIKEIIKLGHWLGLHYNTYSKEEIVEGIQILENHFDVTIKAVSQHNPSISKAMRFNKKEIDDAYSEKFTKEIKYISDSLQNWREGCFCSHINKQNKMQILVHPILWSEKSYGKKEIFQKLHDKIMDDVEKEVFFLFGGQPPKS